jgi:hypothetical protein
MWDHAADEIDIGVAGEADVHVAVHAVVGRPERRDGGVLAGGRSARRATVLMGCHGGSGPSLWGRRCLAVVVLPVVALPVMAMTVLLGASHGGGGKEERAGENGGRDARCHGDDFPFWKWCRIRR